MLPLVLAAEDVDDDDDDDDRENGVIVHLLQTVCLRSVNVQQHGGKLLLCMSLIVS